MNREQVLSNSRLAGAVKRYHTWPTLQQQTVADHIFNVLRIYWHLYGPPPSAVFTYILWSDAGELRTGDLPFPVKKDNPALKNICDKLEVAAVAQLGGRLPELTDDARWQVRAVDLLEMYEFGRTELMLGNQFAHPIIQDTYAALRKLESILPGSSIGQVALHVYPACYQLLYVPVARYLQKLDEQFGNYAHIAGEPACM